MLTQHARVAIPGAAPLAMSTTMGAKPSPGASMTSSQQPSLVLSDKGPMDFMNMSAVEILDRFTTTVGASKSILGRYAQ